MPRNKTSAQRFGGSSSLMNGHGVSRSSLQDAAQFWSTILSQIRLFGGFQPEHNEDWVVEGKRITRSALSDRDRCLRYRAPELRVMAEKKMCAPLRSSASNRSREASIASRSYKLRGR